MFGSSVNVTCTAVSYPKFDPNPEADPDANGIQHPLGVTKNHQHITPEMDGIIYEIDSAADNDSGLYKCHLTVYCMDQAMMGEMEKNLTVTNQTSKTLKLYNIECMRKFIHYILC